MNIVILRCNFHYCSNILNYFTQKLIHLSFHFKSSLYFTLLISSWHIQIFYSLYKAKSISSLSRTFYIFMSHCLLCISFDSPKQNIRKPKVCVTEKPNNTNQTPFNRVNTHFSHIIISSSNSLEILHI